MPGRSITLFPNDYLVGVGSNTPGENMCVVLINTVDNDHKDEDCVTLILEITLLWKYYAIFDLENRRIGLARMDPVGCNLQSRKSRSCNCRIL